MEVDTNRYSVPWRLIGESVTVVVAEREVQVLYGGQLVARHGQSSARRTTVVDRAHLVGIVGAASVGMPWTPRRGEERAAAVAPPPPSELLRPLEQYEAAIGGRW